MTAVATAPSTPTCTRLHCDRPATRRVKAKYAEPWFGCDEHWRAMEAAFWIGQPVDSGEVTVTRIGGAS